MYDHAIFIQLHQTQVDLYNHYSKLVRKPNSTETRSYSSFLSDCRIFLLICTHPYLLSLNEKLQKKKIRERDVIVEEEHNNNCTNISDGWWKPLMPLDVSKKISYGNKLVVLKAIIEECEVIGDKM